MVEDDILFTNYLVGTEHSTHLNKNYISISFRRVVGCDWSKPVQTSPVRMILKGIAWLIVSLLLWTSTREAV